MNITRIGALTLTLALLSACGGADDSQAAAGKDSAATAGGGMEGMQMPEAPVSETGLSEEMRSHMAAMRAASGDSLKALVPMHRQMAANMLAQMNREMIQMNMTADAAWTATVDSLRQDLTSMPDLNPDELQATLPGHEGRLTRLAEMHRAMMASMGM